MLGQHAALTWPHTGTGVRPAAERAPLRRVPRRHPGDGRPRRQAPHRARPAHHARPARRRLALRRGHRLRIEVAQDDDPYIKSSVAAEALDPRRGHAERAGARAVGAIGVRPAPAPPALAAPGQRPGHARASGSVCRRARHPRPLSTTTRSRCRDTASRTGPAADLAPARLAGPLRRRRAARTGSAPGRSTGRGGGLWVASRTIVPLDDARTPLSYRGRWWHSAQCARTAGGCPAPSRRGAPSALRLRGAGSTWSAGVASGGKALVRINGRRRSSPSTAAARVTGWWWPAAWQAPGREPRADQCWAARARSARGRRVEIDAIRALRGRRSRSGARGDAPSGAAEAQSTTR